MAKLYRERLQELIKEKSKKMLGLNGGTQVVPAEELVGWIEQG